MSSIRALRGALAGLLLVLVAGPHALLAQDASPTPPPSPAPSAAPSATPSPKSTPAPSAKPPKPKFQSARETYTRFLRAASRSLEDPQALALAIRCLDLSEIDEEDHDLYGRVYVSQLRTLLVKGTHARLDQIPTESNAPPFVLYRDPSGKGEVVLKQVKGQWKFSGRSLEQLQEMLAAQVERARAAPPPVKPKPQPKAKTYAHVSDWVRAHVPANMTGRAFLLEFWQWGALGFLVLVGLVIHVIAIAIVSSVIVRALRATGAADPDPANVRTGVRPFGLLVMTGFWWGAIGWIGLHADVLRWSTIAIKSLSALAAVWGLYRLVDVVCDALERKALKTESRYDDLLVPLIRKSLKVFVVAFGIVFIADTLQFSIKSLLAGLGLGGLAFALAAQDTVKNFFGSITVVLDRPFEVGDWVLIDKVEGSVEELGFRSTRIRTFYNSVITLPNAKLLTAVVDNMGRRQYRRWTTKIGVSYHTSPEQLEALCEGIRELIRSHPYTRKDYFQVSVTALAGSSIEVMVYAFFETPDWGRELRERQRLILDTLRLCRALGVEIAFPTQTVHLVNTDDAAAALRAADDAIPVSSTEAAQNTGKIAAQRILAPEARTTARLANQERLEDLRRAEVEAKEKTESERLRGEIDDAGATGGEGEGGGEG
jgi:MscS family membrane protein